MGKKGAAALLCILLVWCASASFAASSREVARRMEADLAAGHPLVAHLTVLLADAGFQDLSIHKSAEANGTLETNLYYGAPGGLLPLFSGKNGWTELFRSKAGDGRIAQRLVFSRQVKRQGRNVTLYLVADCWEGRYVQEAMKAFWAHARGAQPETLKTGGAAFEAGGKAHLVAYAGYNGMADIPAPYEDNANISPEEEWFRLAAARPEIAWDIGPRVRLDEPNAAVALTSHSKAFFKDKLYRQGAHPLLLTANAVKPDLYALPGTLEAWAEGKTVAEILSLAADSYLKANRLTKKEVSELFWGAE